MALQVGAWRVGKAWKYAEPTKFRIIYEKVEEITSEDPEGNPVAQEAVTQRIEEEYWYWAKDFANTQDMLKAARNRVMQRLRELDYKEGKGDPVEII
jgi:hypothetical protein